MWVAYLNMQSGWNPERVTKEKRINWASAFLSQFHFICKGVSPDCSRSCFLIDSRAHSPTVSPSHGGHSTDLIQLAWQPRCRSPRLLPPLFNMSILLAAALDIHRHTSEVIPTLVFYTIRLMAEAERERERERERGSIK